MTLILLNSLEINSQIQFDFLNMIHLMSLDSTYKKKKVLQIGEVFDTEDKTLIYS